MTTAQLNAYRLARQGLGWEDIQIRCPSLSQSEAWEIVCNAHRENSHG